MSDIEIKKTNKNRYIGVPMSMVTDKKLSLGAYRLHSYLLKEDYFGNNKLVDKVVTKVFRVHRTTIWRWLDELKAQRYIEVELRTKSLSHNNVTKDRIITIKRKGRGCGTVR